MTVERDQLREQTIADFGDQWTRYRDNEGFYGSQALFADMLGPLVDPEWIRCKRVADIGSGTGRIVAMLLGAGAAEVTAIEPSDAFDVLAENTRAFANRVRLVRGPGEAIPEDGAFDAVFSIGVLHHVPDPDPIVVAARRALRPGGRLVVWLYGKEGNGLYLALLNAVRAVSRHVPHVGLVALTWALYVPLAAYIGMCKHFPLPLGRYMTEVIGRMSPQKRRLVIYDQLKPAYAKYYTRDEAIALLARNGFADIDIHHRHGYSWTVAGTRGDG